VLTRKQFGWFVKPPVFVLSLVPLGLLVMGVIQDTLGANPIEVLTRSTGEWGLRFLFITLCMTPIQKLFKQTWPIKLRRMLGLFAFFYVSVHLTTYLWLDQFFDWAEIWHDIVKRPFILVGMLAFVLLIPLAVTSNQWMMRKMGRLWKRLHQLIYPIALLGVLHFYWLVKKDLLTPTIYLTILMVLLGYRVIVFGRRKYLGR
jgi:sulfoxide reductase heme-binding subunit YedZ